MAKRALKSIVTRFCNELDRMGIHTEEVLLYGSYRWGTARPGSDIDLIVISPDWQPYSERERLEILGTAAVRILESVQAIGFTPSEVASKELTPFWEHILNEEASPYRMSSSR